MRIILLILFQFGILIPGNCQKIIPDSLDGGYLVRVEKIRTKDVTTGFRNDFIFETSYLNGNFEFHLMSPAREKTFFIIKTDSSICFKFDKGDTLKEKLLRTVSSEELFIIFHIDSLDAVLLSKNKISAIRFLIYDDSTTYKMLDSSGQKRVDEGKLTLLKNANYVSLELKPEDQANIQNSISLLLKWLELKSSFDNRHATENDVKAFQDQYFVHYTEKELRKARWH